MSSIPVYRIDPASIIMANLANSLREAANRADGYHASGHGGTYGAATEALKKALWCGFRPHTRWATPTELDRAVDAIYEECIDNGEDVTYQIENVFRQGSGYVDPDGRVWFVVEVVGHEPTCDCGDPTCSCECVPGGYLCEHGTMGAGCGS